MNREKSKYIHALRTFKNDHGLTGYVPPYNPEKTEDIMFTNERELTMEEALKREQRKETAKKIGKGALFIAGAAAVGVGAYMIADRVMGDGCGCGSDDGSAEDEAALRAYGSLFDSAEIEIGMC